MRREDELYPGYRQDHTGRTYQVSRTGELITVPVTTRPFTMRFLADEKGHVWYFGNGPTRVMSCRRVRCTVCGPARTNNFEVVT